MTRLRPCATSTPTDDWYGGHRPGDGLFGESLVCVDLKTGQRKWHFQFVHHPIWNFDMSSAPLIADVTVDGKPRKVVAVPSKQSWLYVFDRVTGEPIWPIVETPVMKSEAPGEVAAPTQPIPTKPAPYAQQGLVEEDLIDYTPAIKEAALKVAKRCRMGPYFIPAQPGDGSAPSGLTCSWYAPGASGGVNIDGGAAADPDTGLLYVAAQTGLSTMEVNKDPCSEFRYSSTHDSCGQLGALPPPPGYKKPAGGRGGRTIRRSSCAPPTKARPGGLGRRSPRPCGSRAASGRSARRRGGPAARRGW